jgi:hypothetical protein
MAYEQQGDGGSFNVNQKKTMPNHADFTGSVIVSGVEYWINVWAKNGSKGEFWNVSLKAKEARQSTSEPVSSGTSSLSRATSAPVSQPDLDDEIPF